MTREYRDWHPAFKKYMKFIVDHPNYEGMPEPYKDDGSIKWITAGKSDLGKRRYGWWEIKAAELKISTEGKWISATAKKNHPTKLKVCQICGREMSIEYIYPAQNLIIKLNRIAGYEEDFVYEDFRDIRDIVRDIIGTLGQQGYSEIAKWFSVPRKIPKTIQEYCNYIYDNFVRAESGFLSPGAMSNAPDRLDGFHTYNICCRSDQDKGRHQENLSRYIEDRRAYEHWSDGDWKTASWLMQKGHGKCCMCSNEGDVTADHIGPISLGFAHLPIFQPLCRSCNSAKNNRMFLSDVKKLIELEHQGEQVISWHSKYLWDRLKSKVTTEQDAKKLSKLMRTAHHHFLEILYAISRVGYQDFLFNYLNPDYALFERIEFVGLDQSTYSYKSISKIPGTKTQYHNNAARYGRIAFESLEEYQTKLNRNILIRLTEHMDAARDIICVLRKDRDRNEPLAKLFHEAFLSAEKETRGEIIKKCFEEWKKYPHKNSEADRLLKKALEMVANRLAELW